MSKLRQIGGLFLGILVATSAAQAHESSSRNRYKVPHVEPQTTYSVVRGNPRSPKPIKSIEEAISIAATSEAVRNDVCFRLINGLPIEYHSLYRSKIVPAFYQRVRAARAHNLMSGTCRTCGNGCEIQKQLRDEVLRIAIPRGTVYAAVTEGYGKTRYNRMFKPKSRETYYSLRVYLRDVLCKEEDDEKQTYQLYASTYIDLIFKCSNMALGEVELLEVWQGKFEKPEVEIRYKEREKIVKVPVEVVREKIIQPGMSYTPAQPSQARTWQYNAGSIGVQPVPVQRVSVNQKQVQLLKNWLDIVNNNINVNQNENNIAVADANANGGGKH